MSPTIATSEEIPVVDNRHISAAKIMGLLLCVWNSLKSAFPHLSLASHRDAADSGYARNGFPRSKTFSENQPLSRHFWVLG